MLANEKSHFYEVCSKRFSEKSSSINIVRCSLTKFLMNVKYATKGIL